MATGHAVVENSELLFKRFLSIAMELSELIKTPKVDGVYLHDQLHATIEGTLCVTGHYLLLSARENNVKELWVSIYIYIIALCDDDISI